MNRESAKRTVVLVNRNARRATEDRRWRPALEALTASGSGGEVEVRESADAEEGRALVSEAVAAGAGRLVAAGGDGTVNGVVNALAEAGALERVALGILPLGTANDCARSLGLPLEPRAAVERVLRGRTRRVDLGRVDLALSASDPDVPATEAAEASVSRHFANVSVGGFGGRVEERVEPGMKRRWGPLAYLKAAAEEIARPERYGVQARLDGEALDREVLHVIVANGSRAGGNIPVAPEARPDDGLLDVVLVPALELPELLALVPRFLAGRATEDDRLVVRRAERAAFRAEPPMPFGTDGEPIGKGAATYRCLPGALEVIV